MNADYTPIGNRLDDPYDADKKVFEELQKRGFDFSLQHEVNFHFLGSAEGLQLIKSTLEAQGFYMKESPTSGKLVIHKQLFLELNSMHTLTEQLERLADISKTNYDGWETKV